MLDGKKENQNERQLQEKRLADENMGEEVQKYSNGQQKMVSLDVEAIKVTKEGTVVEKN